MPREKELGAPKPSDVFIGVIDLFAVLVPGVMAVGVIAVALRATLRTDSLFVSGLVVAGWVMGHVLHGIGSWLDPLVYDPLFKPQDRNGSTNLKTDSSKPRATGSRWAYLHKNDALHRLALDLTQLPSEPPGEMVKRVPGGMYQWARAWLSTHSAEATANLDRLEADSKLFRSLTVLLIAAVPALSLTSLPLDTPAQALQGKVSMHAQLNFTLLALAGIIFSLWRYCDLRNKMIRRCYLHYVQLRMEESKRSESANTVARSQ